MTEAGSASFTAIVWVAVIVLITAGLAGVGRLVAAQAQATAAADAAALAAAPLTFLEGDPLAEAAAYASHNGSRLVTCRCERDPRLAARVVTVEVASEVQVPLFGWLTVRARAAAEFDPMDLLLP